VWRVCSEDCVGGRGGAQDFEIIEVRLFLSGEVASFLVFIFG